MCQRRSDFLMASVIDSERLQFSNNYIPIEQPNFQSAATHLPASWAVPESRLQLFRQAVIILFIFQSSPPIMFCAQCLRGLVGLCTDLTMSSNTLSNGGAGRVDPWFHVANYLLSLSQNNCNRFRGSWCIRSHHQFPCLYFVGRAWIRASEYAGCYSYLLYNYTGRMAQWLMRPTRYPQGPGFEPGLFHEAFYMPPSVEWS